MSNTSDRYLLPAYASPRSPQQSNFPPKATPTSMTRSASSDPHRVLGYFDIPSRSAPSSPQTSYLPYSPASRSSSPARDPRRSRDFNFSHSGSDLEDALVGFSLVPNWLKMAMEQDQRPNSSSSAQKSTSLPNQRPHKYSPFNSPDSLMSSSNEVTPITPRTPQLNLTIPRSKDEAATETQIKPEEEDRRYWEEEDEGYFGELDEDEDEDLEEAYRSVL